MVNSVPDWRLTGDWFDLCSCDIPCPCEFAQPPTGNRCMGILAWNIRQGNYGDVQLDGFSIVALGAFEGNIWTGGVENSVMGLYVDDRTDDQQREALLALFGGQAGGWPAGFAALIQTMRGIEFVPIQFEVADGLASWQVEIPGKVFGKAEALTGPTTPPGQRVQTLNPPGSEVGPGGPATWGQTTTSRADGFGFTWEGVARSSKHIPFDWSGPGSA